MNDPYQWWLLLVGIAVGAGAAWLLLGAVPREEDDVRGGERAAEADWISASVARGGGVAPPELVEDVLALHARYLRGPAIETTDDIEDEPLMGEPVEGPARRTDPRGSSDDTGGDISARGVTLRTRGEPPAGRG